MVDISMDENTTSVNEDSADGIEWIVLPVRVRSNSKSKKSSKKKKAKSTSSHSTDKPATNPAKPKKKIKKNGRKVSPLLQTPESDDKSSTCDKSKKKEKTKHGEKIVSLLHNPTTSDKSTFTSQRPTSRVPSQTSPSRKSTQRNESDASTGPTTAVPPRNESSSCSATASVPPPPLRRSADFVTPGATRVPGIRTRQPQRDEEQESSSSSDPTVPQSDPTPLLSASLVVQDVAVHAEPMGVMMMTDAKSELAQSSFSCCCSSFGKVRRCRLLVCFLVLAIVCLAAGITLMLLHANNSSSNGESSSLDNLLLLDPPTQEDCLAIANGREISGQAELILKTFQVDMDVVLDQFEDDIVVPWLDILREQMQRIIAPALVGCHNNIFHLRRHLRQRRKAEEQNKSDSYVIGNAIFDSIQAANSGQLSSSCTAIAAASDSCVRVTAHIQLFVVDSTAVKLSQLMNRIMMVLLLEDEDTNTSLVDRLELNTPFVSIHMVGVTSRDPATASPTAAPISNNYSIPSAPRPTLSPAFASPSVGYDDPNHETSEDGYH
eukprot:scaffold115_cov123-Cylindrotheca_fusiformis.AAC.2